MSVTFGAYTLRSPAYDGDDNGFVAPGASWTTGTGSKRTHILTTRKTWNYTWVVYSSEMANIWAAVLAAISAPVSFVPWDEATTYSVQVPVESASKKPKPLANDTEYTITCTIEEVTA
ncbi:MAG: hypothetical protein ACYC5O_00865 [Anaerolineae bacterium]